MGIALFFLLSMIVAAAVAYPLLPGRAADAAQSIGAGRTWTDGRIEGAVRRIRKARSQSSLTCPDCGKAYQAGDLFCVRCGAGLPQEKEAPDGRVCPSCGAILRPDDVFCSRCGHRLIAEEAGG
jgi:predicted RNA-binding Zn-ribbon protein involved in translation (DUF1610 family)